MAPEALFEPSLFKKFDDDDIEGIAKLCINSIKDCDESIRKDLSRNIILSGGNTLYRGLPERLY